MQPARHNPATANFANMLCSDIAARHARPVFFWPNETLYGCTDAVAVPNQHITRTENKSTSLIYLPTGPRLCPFSGCPPGKLLKLRAYFACQWGYSLQAAPESRQDRVISWARTMGDLRFLPAYAPYFCAIFARPRTKQRLLRPDQHHEPIRPDPFLALDAATSKG